MNEQGIIRTYFDNISLNILKPTFFYIYNLPFSTFKYWKN